MVIIIEEMESATDFQILDEVVCISIHANDLWKGINPFLLPPNGK